MKLFVVVDDNGKIQTHYSGKTVYRTYAGAKARVIKSARWSSKVFRVKQLNYTLVEPEKQVTVKITVNEKSLESLRRVLAGEGITI